MGLLSLAISLYFCAFWLISSSLFLTCRYPSSLVSSRHISARSVFRIVGASGVDPSRLISPWPIASSFGEPLSSSAHLFYFCSSRFSSSSLLCTFDTSRFMQFVGFCAFGVGRYLLIYSLLISAHLASTNLYGSRLNFSRRFCLKLGFSRSISASLV